MHEPHGKDRDEVNEKKMSAHLYAAEDMDDASSNGENNRLPESYGVDYVAIIPKSPTWLFVYWELSGSGSRPYRGSHVGGADWRLSLINVKESGGVNWRTEVGIDPDAGNHYLHVQPGERYRVELGVRTEGLFHPVCHSRQQRVPRDTPAEPPEAPIRTEARWTDGAKAPEGGKTGPEKDVPAGLVWDENVMQNQSSS